MILIQQTHRYVRTLCRRNERTLSQAQKLPKESSPPNNNQHDHKSILFKFPAILKIL